MYIRSMINLSLILFLVFSKIGVTAKVSDISMLKNTVSYTVEYICGESTEVLQEEICVNKYIDNAESFIKENRISDGWEFIGETTE